MTPNAKNLPRLLDPKIFSGPRTMYVYRMDASGRPDGAYIRKYTQQMTMEALKADLQPGTYRVIESGGGDPVASTRLDLPQEGNPVLSPLVDDEQDDVFRTMKRMLELRVLERQLQPDPNPMEMAIKLLEALRRPGAEDPLEAFQMGLDFAGETLPADPAAVLAGAVSKAVTTPQAPPGSGENSAAALAELNRVKKAVIVLNRQIVTLKTALDSAVSAIPPPAPPPPPPPIPPAPEPVPPPPVAPPNVFQVFLETLAANPEDPDGAAVSLGLKPLLEAMRRDPAVWQPVLEVMTSADLAASILAPARSRKASLEPSEAKPSRKKTP